MSKANPSLTFVCLLFILAACCASVAAAPLFVDQKGTIPADAKVLFDGKDLSQWVRYDGKQPEWILKKGYIQAKGGDLQTKESFGDCQLHVEFWLPLMEGAKGQDRGNSGVFLNAVYEIQILDSYNIPEVEEHGCGAIYDEKRPLANACRPPKTWQTYDIIFHSPKFDAAGKKSENARFTVFLNGVLIQDNADAPTPTRYHNAPDMAKGPVQIQDHGHPIRMRNIWIRPLVK